MEKRKYVPVRVFKHPSEPESRRALKRGRTLTRSSTSEKEGSRANLSAILNLLLHMLLESNEFKERYNE
jgi:hypothetical protein